MSLETPITRIYHATKVRKTLSHSSAFNHLKCAESIYFNALKAKKVSML